MAKKLLKGKKKTKVIRVRSSVAKGKAVKKKSASGAQKVLFIIRK